MKTIKNNGKLKLLIIDTAGMAGSAMAKYMRQHGHDVTPYDDDLFDRGKIGERLDCGRFDAVINCAAIVNRHADEEPDRAVYINAYLPHYLAALTKGTRTVVVHRSTDCVFSGEKGSYTVNDRPDGQSIYARTEALGEIINEKDLTIRTSLIGVHRRDGEGLLDWFLRQRGEVKGYANAVWTGISTLEFARQTENLIERKAHGLIHLVPDRSISKYELLCLFEKYFPAGRKIVRWENDRVDKSLIPFTGGYSLNMPGYEEMIEEISREKN